MTPDKEAIFEERLSNVKDQCHRLMSHLESEERVKGEQSKRIGEVEYYNKRLVESYDKLDKILYNGGEGILFKLDRIQRALENAKDSKRWNVGLILSIIFFSTLIAIAAIVMK